MTNIIQSTQRTFNGGQILKIKIQNNLLSIELQQRTVHQLWKQTYTYSSLPESIKRHYYTLEELYFTLAYFNNVDQSLRIIDNNLSIYCKFGHLTRIMNLPLKRVQMKQQEIIQKAQKQIQQYKQIIRRNEQIVNRNIKQKNNRNGFEGLKQIAGGIAAGIATGIAVFGIGALFTSKIFK